MAAAGALVVMGAVQIGAAIFGGLMGGAAASKAKQAARTQAQLKLLTTNEQIRRQRITNEQTLGTTVARAAASGVVANKFGTTPSEYVKSMASEFATEIDWMRKAGFLEARALSLGASAQYTSDLTSVFGSTAGGILQGVGTIYKP